MTRFQISFSAFCLVTTLGTGCTSSKGDTGGVEEEGGLAVLGDGSHSIDGVDFTVIANENDDLDIPRDLAFNPYRDGELWVVSTGNESMILIFDAGTDAQVSDRRSGMASNHFFANPAALAFGTSEMAATAQDEDESTQPATPVDFMGPTMWNTDLDLFDAGWASHMDMLHNSPNSAGIAWEQENVYWVFDGYHESLTRYDFHEDHGPAGEDHSDGEIGRYVEDQVSYVEDVSSHLVFDAPSATLYVADTGNSRIAALDTNTGENGGSILPNYDWAQQRHYDDAVMTTLVDGTEHDLQQPSGLELHEDVLYVSDHATGFIHGFDLDGNQVDWLDTGLGEGALMGMSFHSDGSLYVTDAKDNQVLRIAAK